MDGYVTPPEFPIILPMNAPPPPAPLILYPMAQAGPALQHLVNVLQGLNPPVGPPSADWADYAIGRPEGPTNDIVLHFFDQIHPE